MRSRAFRLTLLSALLLAAGPARAGEDDWGEPPTEEETAPPPKAQPRKHAKPIEGGESAAPAEDSPPPAAPARGRASAPDEDGSGARAGSEDEAPPRRSAEDEDAPPRRRPADDAEEGPRRRATDDEEGGSRRRAGDDDEGGSRRRGGDEDEGGSRRRASDDEDSPRRRGSDGDDEDRPRRGGGDEFEDEGRRSRTVEEEMGEHEVWEDESLSEEDEPGNGFGVQVVAGAMLLDDPIGGYNGRFLMGLMGDWQISRKLFPPEEEWLHNALFVEVSYLYTGHNFGTDQVKVDAGYHYLSAAGMLGYPISPELLGYVKLGPTLNIMPTTYAVKVTETQVEENDFTGVKPGFLYGVGARANLYLTNQAGVMGRLEVTGYRRGYMNDLLLSASVGVAF